MTLEEAIRSNEDLELSYRYRMHHLPSEEAKKVCLQIATNYHQQAEWLKELAERRKKPEIIYCGECELKIECCRNIRSGGRKDDDFCSCGRRSERRTDGSD